MAMTKVMISFPEEFLTEVDRLAQEEHRSRSALLREAMRHYMRLRQREQRPGDRPRVQKAIAVQDALSRLSSGEGEDSTDDIRRWRDRRDFASLSEE